MKQSELFRENAENCAQLAEGATAEPLFNRYKRMEAAWLALANEQDWLDGEVSPARIAIANGRSAPRAPISEVRKQSQQIRRIRPA